MRLRSVDPPFGGAGALGVVAEHEPALELAADAAQGRRGEHALRRAARAHIDVDRRVGIGDRDHPGDVAVGDELDAAAERAQLGDQVGVARPVEHADDDVGRVDALGGGDRRGYCRTATRARSITPAGIAGADGELVHIDVGRVEQAALLGDGEHGERVGAGLGGDRRAFERVEGDVDLRARCPAPRRPSRRYRASAPRRARPRR